MLTPFTVYLKNVMFDRKYSNEKTTILELYTGRDFKPNLKM